MDDSIVQRAVESGDQAVAEEAFRKYDAEIQVSSDASEKANLLLGKAVLYGVFHRFEESRGSLELALAQAPMNQDVQLQADFVDATLYDQEGNHEKAFERLTEVLSRYHERLTTRPDLRFAYEDIQLRRGLDAVQIGKFQEASVLLRESSSFALEPEDMSNVWSSLGLCYSELGEYELSKESFVQALKIGLTKEWEGEVHMRLGIAYAHLGLLKEAKKEFRFCEENVAEYGLEVSKIYQWLSWVCQRLGENAESEKYVRLAHPS